MVAGCTVGKGRQGRRFIREITCYTVLLYLLQLYAIRALLAIIIVSLYNGTLFDFLIRFKAFIIVL